MFKELHQGIDSTIGRKDLTGAVWRLGVLIAANYLLTESPPGFAHQKRDFLQIAEIISRLSGDEKNAQVYQSKLEITDNELERIEGQILSKAYPIAKGLAPVLTMVAAAEAYIKYCKENPRT